MKQKTLDLRNFRCVGELHDMLAELFGFPDYYGRNLDALYDLLTDFSEDTCVIILMPEDSEQENAEDAALRAYAGRVLRVFQDAAGGNSRLTLRRENLPEAEAPSFYKRNEGGKML